MRFLDRMLGRQGYWEGLASGAAVMTTSYAMDGRESPAGAFAAQTQQAYAGNGVVFAVVLARLSLFAEASLKWQSLATKKLFGNGDLSLLEHPWPNCTTGELFARMEQDVSLAGNAFLWRAESDRLVRLPPDEVTIISREERDPAGRPYREVVGYDWDPGKMAGLRSEKAVSLDVDEVAHWSPYPDPCAAWRGMSWLTPVLREIAADSAMTQYKTVYLSNAASPNLLIKYDMKLKPETIDALRERVQARYAGVNNAFKTLVLDQGADATVIGSKLNEMDFADVQAAGENRICVASGVPAIIVGLKEGLSAATYSNYEQAMRRFADITMRPLWRSACAALQKLVSAPQGSRLWYDTSDIAALRQSETEQAQTMQVKAAALQTFVQAGATLESAVEAVSSGDISQLQAAPQQTLPGLPPPPSRVPGPESGNGKGPTPGQMTSMPPTLVGAPRPNGRALALQDLDDLELES